MREFRMLKIMAMATTCVFTLSACGVANTLMAERYRTQHLRFAKQEYQKSPGVLLRASVGAWGKYNEAEKLAAIIDYYTDPEQKLKSENIRYQFGMEVEKVFDNLSSSKFKRPVPQKLGRVEALKRVQCLNSLFSELSKKNFRRFLNARYPLFKAEAQCSAFLSRNPIPMRCVGWKFSTSGTTQRVGTNLVTSHRLRGNLVNKCAS